jgi:hypothetical protein
MPLSEPHELTLALADTIFFELGVVVLATALLGRARAAAVTATSAGLNRMAGYPVMTTETPVTFAAERPCELKLGVAVPVPSSVPVTSVPSWVLPDPVNVTL